MTEFKVSKIEQTIEYVGHLKYNIVCLVIPNLEHYDVTHESVLNFQSRLFCELSNLFWEPYIRIERDNFQYRYTIRVYNIYSLKNVNKLEEIVNRIFEKFPFKRYSNKRRIINETFIRNKISRLNI
jgi:hypothetical protein